MSFDIDVAIDSIDWLLWLVCKRFSLLKSDFQ